MINSCVLYAFQQQETKRHFTLRIHDQQIKCTVVIQIYMVFPYISRRMKGYKRNKFKGTKKTFRSYVEVSGNQCWPNVRFDTPEISTLSASKSCQLFQIRLFAHFKMGNVFEWQLTNGYICKSIFYFIWIWFSNSWSTLLALKKSYWR